MVKTSVQTRLLQRRRAAFKQELLGFALLALGLITAIVLGADSVLATAIGLSVYAIWHLIQAARLLSFLLTGSGSQTGWV